MEYRVNVSEDFIQRKKEFEENGFTIFTNVIDQDLLIEANRDCL